MPEPKEMAAKIVEVLYAKLKLNSDQKTKILAIVTNQQQQLVKIMSENKGNKEAIYANAMKIMNEGDAKINGLLTTEQKKAFIALKEEQQAKMMKAKGK